MKLYVKAGVHIAICYGMYLAKPRNKNKYLERFKFIPDLQIIDLINSRVVASRPSFTHHTATLIRQSDRLQFDCR